MRTIDHVIVNAAGGAGTRTSDVFDPDTGQVQAVPVGDRTADALRANGHAAREFDSRVQVGMVGINVPIPYHSFGGWKRSAFSSINQKTVARPECSMRSSSRR